MTTTWSATDKAAAISLSPDQLTASTSSGSFVTGRATVSETTGRYYWEFGWTAGSAPDVLFGLANATHSLTDFLGGGGSSTDGIGLEGNGPTFGAIGGSSGWAGAAVNDVVGMAVDVDAQRFWLRLNGGAWLNGDPVAATGGGTWTFSGAVFPATTIAAGNSTLANFGDSTFSATAPTGFNSGWPGGPPPPPAQVRTAKLIEHVALNTQPLLGAGKVIEHITTLPPPATAVDTAKLIEHVVVFATAPPEGLYLVALLPPAELQFCDANGKPYAGGTIETYQPGTSTPKSTWQDAAADAPNTNPIILDAAGRAIIYGDGLYRTILRDASGTLVWDEPTNTYISVAMAPVVAAATIPDAVVLLGIGALIATEAAARVAADAAEAAARAAADATELARAQAAELVLTNALAAEIARAEAAEAALAAAVPVTTIKAGMGNTDATGTGAVVFPTPYTGGTTVNVVATPINTPINVTMRVTAATINGFSVGVEDTDNRGGVATPFYWIASGT